MAPVCAALTRCWLTATGFSGTSTGAIHFGAGMAKRKGLSKGTRYAVLARDGFLCRYCGARPDTGAVLVVDHIIPVKEGGSNDPANLITACQPCNAGKSAKSPENAAATPPDYERLLATRRELEDTAHAIREVESERDSVVQEVVNLLCENVGRNTFHEPTAKQLAYYVTSLGHDIVVPWIVKACAKFPHSFQDKTIGRYVSGCRRIYLEGLREIEEAERVA